MPARVTINRRMAVVCLGIAVIAGTAIAMGANDVPSHTEHQVDISDFSYNPDPVIVRQGDLITWTNQDIVPHTATITESDIGTGEILLSESQSMVMDKTGVVDYHCRYHAGMRGQIIVK